MSRPRRQSRRRSAAKPPPPNLALAALVDLLFLDQQQVSETLHIAPGTVSDLVSGKKKLQPDNYRRKCAEFGGKAPAAGDQLLALAEWLGAEADLGPATSPGGVISEICGEAERLATALPAKVRVAIAEKARQQAVALWKGIQQLEVHEWRLIAVAPEVRTWAFVKLVGEESERAASVDAGRALELASFALWVAERVPGDEGWISRVFGWATLSNAHRVGGELAIAEEALACSARLQAEPPEGRPELPEPWRLLDLEASLRIDLAPVARSPATARPGGGGGPPVGFGLGTDPVQALDRS